MTSAGRTLISLRLRHKLLSTGYHHVVDLNSHHLFVQWPKGELAQAEHISSNYELSDFQKYQLLQHANRLAGGAVDEIQYGELIS